MIRKKTLAKLIPLLGISSYCAWNVLDRSGLLGIGGFSSSLDHFIITGVTAISALIILPLAALIQRSLIWKITQVLFSTLAVFVALGFGVSYVIENNHAILQITTILLAVLRAGTFVFWFIWLVSKQKYDFVHTLISTAIMSAFFFLLAISLPPAFSFMQYILLIAFSGTAFLSIKEIPFASEGEREIHPKYTQPALYVFILIRFLLGFALGLTAALLPLQISLPSESSIKFAAFIFCALSLALVFKYKKDPSPSLTICIPAILSSFIIAPTALALEASSQVIIVLVWFSSMYLSAVHLFRNSGLMDMNLPYYVALSQILSTIGTFAGSNILAWFDRFFQLNEINSEKIAIALAIFAVLIIVTQYLIAQTVLVESPRVISSSLAQTVKSVSARFGLTARERDVLELLAEGYSRPFISEKLSLSLSTVKTHVNHMYAKMGINKRDELLRIIGEEQRRIGGDSNC